MFYGITDLTTFIVGTILIVLLPGPNSLYVMTVAARAGIAAGYAGALGIFTGDLILMTLTATGVASLFAANPLFLVALKYAGAAYLVYLGFNLLRVAYQRWQSGSTSVAAVSATTAKPFRIALAISLINPKAILFYLSFFIQFVSTDYPYPGLSFLILGAIVQLCSILYLSMLILGGKYLAAAFHRHRQLAASSMGGAACLFIGFGIKLALAGL